MKRYRIRTKAGVYAGSVFKINRYGDLCPTGFAPTTSKLLARVYTADDQHQIRADVVRLAEFVRESVEGFTLEEIQENAG